MGLDCERCSKSAEEKKQKKNIPWEKETTRGRYDKCRTPTNLSRDYKGRSEKEK